MVDGGVISGAINFRVMVLKRNKGGLDLCDDFAVAASEDLVHK